MPKPSDDATAIAAAILTSAIHASSEDPIIASAKVFATYGHMIRLVAEKDASPGQLKFE